MKKITLITGILTTIGLSIKNMGHLSIENALAYGIVLWCSYRFFLCVWNLIDRKLKK